MKPKKRAKHILPDVDAAHFRAAARKLHRINEIEPVRRIGGCCFALGYDKQTLDFFRAVYMPEGADPDDHWFGSLQAPGTNEARVLALLLCAELLEDGFSAADFPAEDFTGAFV